MSFLGDVLKKTSTSMFLTMFEKSWNIVLAMHISDVFGEHFKRIEKWQVNPFIFATMCDNNVFFYNNLLTKILTWSTISYHIGINIEYPNHF